MDETGKRENSLGLAASAYLRSARFQPVEWMEWGPEAFAKAKAANKPVLLDIGAVWCHWCHVMDRESYENLDTAAVINDFFIAVKVDRDERPDVDARYQAAVQAISGQGGWPLTAFLTPEGRPYFGGGYFPPVDRYGRPGLQRVLLMMAEAYQNRPEEVLETAGSVMEAIQQSESFAGQEGEAGRELLGKMLAGIMGQFDERNGGFGSEPKFPHAGAIDLLVDAAGREVLETHPNRAEARGEDGAPGSEAAGKVARVTLEKMAAGGMYDQLGGGFHRYSVDERWVVPHFEKMAYDNSELLKNYVHAYQAFGDEQYAVVAKDMLRWMDEWLSDRVLGGFYASQDADASLEDDGDYFTWTLAEVREVLSGEELDAAVTYFDVRAVGDMHHNPAKNVLRVKGELFRSAPMNDEAVHQRATRNSVLAGAKAKMYAARLLRETPYVDKTMYAGWNGMCCSAYIAAGRALGMKETVAFGLKSLDRVLNVAWDGSSLGHVVAYGEGLEGTRIAGVLEDYAAVGNAALDAWEATGQIWYYAMAKEIGDAMVERFCDVDEGGVSRGFFDTEKGVEGIGALRAERKPLQDSPTPAGNAIAATLLLRLHALSGDADYERKAMETLATFAGVVEHFGLYAASFALALRRAVEAPVQVCVMGTDAVAEALEAEALKGFAVEKSVVRLGSLKALPPMLAETLPFLVVEGSAAVVCRGGVCLPVVRTVDALRGVISDKG